MQPNQPGNKSPIPDCINAFVNETVVGFCQRFPMVNKSGLDMSIKIDLCGHLVDSAASNQMFIFALWVCMGTESEE